MCHNQDDYRPKPHITKDTETVSYICTGVVWNMAHLHAANGASCRRDLNWSGSFCRYKIRRLYQSVRPSSSFILHSKQRASKFMSFHDMTWHDMTWYYTTGLKMPVLGVLRSVVRISVSSGGRSSLKGEASIIIISTYRFMWLKLLIIKLPHHNYISGDIYLFM